MVKGFAGAGGSRFPDDMLCGDNTGCSEVTDFWVIMFGSSRCDSASAGRGIAFTESVGY